jgi:2-amino-4-hydroxy-6-hydroxymethyldihydropteridine diphosphokinase
VGLTDENSRLAYIALGANLGDPELTFACVAPRLQAFSTTPVIMSRWMRSKPVNCPPGSPDFLNGVVAIRPFPGETPESLLEKLQALETEFGRTPKKELNEARPLDLDIIAFGNQQRATEKLTLPHPRAIERNFVLRPLAEIAPDLVLPGQDKNVIELLAKLDSGDVRT